LIDLVIPGRGSYTLKHLVTDVNGTLACDGELLDDVAATLGVLQDRLQIHMLTANTHGRQAEMDGLLGLKAVIIPPGGETEAKADYVRQLAADSAVAIGQGENDAGMLASAAIGICILSKEGTAVAALQAADVVVPDILTALGLLLHPRRLVATLRA